MINLSEVFEHRLINLFWAEKQLIEVLPKPQVQATNRRLHNIIQNHLEESRTHKKRIEAVCEELNIEPSGETCKTMKGLIEGVESFIAKDTEDKVQDDGLIAEAQRLELYEISGYGTLIYYAEELGFEKQIKKIIQTLQEAYKADQVLSDLARERVNGKAEP